MPHGMGPRVVVAAFADSTVQVPIEDLNALRPVTDAVRKTRKYSQIVAARG